MKKQWVRTTPFEPSNSNQDESWVYLDSESEQKFDVNVQFNKPIDITSLKINILKTFSENVNQIRITRSSLFGDKTDMYQVEFCPICNSCVSNSREKMNIYGAVYVQCSICHHIFLKERPSKAELDDFYSKDLHYQRTYSDKKTLETRIAQVAQPKAIWAIQQFERIYGRKPSSILDVGAGSGHFVQACRNLGLKAEGVEISEPGRMFCKENFGFDLINVDFLEKYNIFYDYELITFWGVIEHVPNPLDMLKTASMLLSGKEGLCIAEVPRWNSFSTTVQSVFSDSIIRHLDPLGHIHCFTDSSLSTAFVDSNFDIIAAWYFGMDAYELVTQLTHKLGDDSVIQSLREFIPLFQNTLDMARLSDEMVIVGKSRFN